jgi:hypothetical protein
MLAIRMMRERRLTHQMDDILEAASRLNEQGQPRLRHLLGSSERRALLAACDASNRRLTSEYGVSFPAQLPDDEAGAPVTDAPLDYLLQLMATLSDRTSSSSDSGEHGLRGPDKRKAQRQAQRKADRQEARQREARSSRKASLAAAEPRTQSSQ